MPSSSETQDDGSTLLKSWNTFGVVAASPTVESSVVEVLPAFPAQLGLGRIIHPSLGAFDYAVKPDEWVNIDADVVIRPVWASTKTLGGAANVLWSGKVRDVVVEERWLALGGLAMPMSMLRMLMLIFTNPVDPADGYVEWYPNYVSNRGFKVLPADLKSGDAGIALDDIIHAKDADGNMDGWVANKVIFTMKIVDRVETEVV